MIGAALVALSRVYAAQGSTMMRDAAKPWSMSQRRMTNASVGPLTAAPETMIGACGWRRASWSAVSRRARVSTDG
jgi:hypothetical protein